jgi:hypothetical protein
MGTKQVLKLKLIAQFFFNTIAPEKSKNDNCEKCRKQAVPISDYIYFGKFAKTIFSRHKTPSSTSQLSTQERITKNRVGNALYSTTLERWIF